CNSVFYLLPSSTLPHECAHYSRPSHCNQPTLFEPHIMRSVAFVCFIGLGAVSATPLESFASPFTSSGPISALAFGNEHSTGKWRGDMEHVGLHDQKPGRWDDKEKHSGKKKHGGKKKHAGWKNKRGDNDDDDDGDDDENVVFKAQVQNLNEYDLDLGRSLHHQPENDLAPWDTNVQDGLDEGEHSLWHTSSHRYPGQWRWRPWWAPRPWWSPYPWWSGNPWGWGQRGN
ncbi:MAG: hypothetical protein J3Q66DRAFT_417255, partial [Benniella sp.]